MKRLFSLLTLLLLLTACASRSSTTTYVQPVTDAAFSSAAPEADTSALVVVPPAESIAEPESAAVSTAPEPDSSAPMDTLPEESAEPEAELPLSGHIICVDAGHGTYSAKNEKIPVAPGADTKVNARNAGVVDADGVSEAEVNLQVALKLQAALEAAGADVVMVRTTDACELDNSQRAAIATDANAELTIRIHADDSNDSSVHGMTMLVPADTYVSGALCNESRAAASLIFDAVLTETGANSRDIVARDDLVGFNYATVPTILLEMGFLSNPDEDALLKDSDYQDKIVSGIVSGTAAYFS